MTKATKRRTDGKRDFLGDLGRDSEVVGVSKFHETLSVLETFINRGGRG